MDAYIHLYTYMYTHMCVRIRMDTGVHSYGCRHTAVGATAVPTTASDNINRSCSGRGRSLPPRPRRLLSHPGSRFPVTSVAQPVLRGDGLITPAQLSVRGRRVFFFFPRLRSAGLPRYIAGRRMLGGGPAAGPGHGGDRHRPARLRPAPRPAPPGGTRHMAAHVRRGRVPPFHVTPLICMRPRARPLGRHAFCGPSGAAICHRAAPPGGGGGQLPLVSAPFRASPRPPRRRPGRRPAPIRGPALFPLFRDAASAGPAAPPSQPLTGSSDPRSFPVPGLHVPSPPQTKRPLRGFPRCWGKRRPGAAVPLAVSCRLEQTLFRFPRVFDGNAGGYVEFERKMLSDGFKVFKRLGGVCKHRQILEMCLI